MGAYKPEGIRIYDYKIRQNEMDLLRYSEEERDYMWLRAAV